MGNFIMANPAHRSGSDEECDTGYSPLKDQTNRQPPLTIEEIKKGIFSTDFKEAFKATQAARKFLSGEEYPPIDVLIDAGIVPKLVAFLSLYDDIFETNMMLLEAVWALTNIASGNSMQTRVVVEAGAVPHFIRLLEYPVSIKHFFTTFCIAFTLSV